LGKLYESGQGVYQNLVRAFEICKKSANKGFIDAQYKLGCFDIDRKKAFDSYKVAAEEDNGEEQKCLAFLYDQGEGTEKDLEQAIYLYKEAIKNDVKKLKKI